MLASVHSSALKSTTKLKSFDCVSERQRETDTDEVEEEEEEGGEEGEEGEEAARGEYSQT